MSEKSDLDDWQSISSFTLPANTASDSNTQNMGLADLARGLQYVVNEAAMAAHLHMQKTLDLYFDEQGNPRCRRVLLPGGAGSVDVPVITLTPPANLMLEQMEVALAVRVTNLRAVSDEAKSTPAPPPEVPEPPSDLGPPQPLPRLIVNEDHTGKTGTPETKVVTPPPPVAPSKPKAKATSFAMETPDEDAGATRKRPLERLSFEIQPAPVSPDSSARRDANVMDIKMTFRRNESPEGVARLVAMYTDAMFRVTGDHK